MFDLKQEGLSDAGVAVSNGSHGLDLGLFWIRELSPIHEQTSSWIVLTDPEFYTYNANAVLVFFW